MMIAKNQSILKITLNFLIYFFPLTFVLGNLVTNAVVVLITILGFLALLKNSIKIKFNLIIILTFLFSICILIVSITNSINIDKAFLFLRYPLFALIVYNLFLNFEFNKNKIILFYSLIILIVSLDIMIQYFSDIILLVLSRLSLVQIMLLTQDFLKMRKLQDHLS